MSRPAPLRDAARQPLTTCVRPWLDTIFDRKVLVALTLTAMANAAGADEAAGDVKRLDAVDVTAQGVSAMDSASSGDISQEQIDARPLLRPGAVLETVPGLVVTQHSGEGKANQYFLRAFNLDHGTDIATRVDGMPINMPTHGHGQGWTDLNFLIPELVRDVRYKKGPYFADEGDFASAASVRMSLLNDVEPGYIELGLGENGYQRGLIINDHDARAGTLLYALEAYHNDGPYVHPDDFQKFNGVLRYNKGDDNNGYSITAMAYDAQWNSTDQIPQRAIDQGLISRFDTIDPTDGGRSYRQSLSAHWARQGDTGDSRASAYFIRSSLDLYSNFTYFMDDPVNGDQFQQRDDRKVAGVDLSHTFYGSAWGKEMAHLFGLQQRMDWIDVGLYRTVRRSLLSTTGEHGVRESGSAIYYENNTKWNPSFRSILGVRGDYYRFNVSDRLDAANSGDKTATLLNPKLGLVFGPYAKTTYFFNIAGGYHSNDARGVTRAIEPATPLVRSKSAEIGLRSFAIPKLETQVALFVLDLASELVFVGDAGTTEASGATRRVGVEWVNHYQINPWLSADANFAYSRSRFKKDMGDAPNTGRYIPGSPAIVIDAGLTAQRPDGWFGSLHMRSFGERPLLEDNSVKSAAFTTFDTAIGYEKAKSWRWALDVFNLLDKEWNDIEYFYASRLAGESAPQNDYHIHPGQPRTFRLSFRYYL